MIYTITFNPAIDYVMRLDGFKSGEVNRSKSEEVYFGGKGINVSVILNELGIKSVALGFVAGFTGKALEDGVKSQGIGTDFVHLSEGITRINVKIKSGDESEINGQGPVIPERAVDELFGRLDKLKKGDILIIAGSVPSTLPHDIYEKILERLDDKGISFVIDASKDLLMNTLKYKPFLIKPNKYELEEIFGARLDSFDDITSHAQKLRELGAVNVLVSLADEGSVLVDENGKVHKMGVCRGEVINSVGAGDSMVAGFVAGYVTSHDYEYALTLATACGGATAFSPGLAKRAVIDRLMEQLGGGAESPVRSPH